jgi:hypothetical protein
MVALLAIGVILYAETLEKIYSSLVAPQFAYIGYYYSPAAWYVSGSATLATVVVALLLPRRLARVSHVVMWVLFAVCVAPAMLMTTYTGYLNPVEALTVTSTIGLSFAVVALLARAPAPPIDESRGGVRPTVSWSIVAGYSGVTYALMAATLGLSLHFVSFSDAYDVRGDFKTDLAGSGLLSYMIGPQANIVNPYLIARGITSKRCWLVALGVLGQLLIYSASGLKTVIFATPAVILMLFLFRHGRRASPLPFIFGPVALMAVSAGADVAQGGSTWTSLFARRFLLTPGLLTSVYARYFSDNPQAHLGTSVLRWWVHDDHGAPPPLIVGQYLRPGANLAANANIFADGFANFGLAGILGVGVLLAVVLRILDRASAGLPLSIAAMVMVMPSITLSNTAILTALLSHGVAAGIALLAVAPRRSSSTERKALSLAPHERLP